MEPDDVSEALIAQRLPVGLRWRIRHAGERGRYLRDEEHLGDHRGGKR
jgi:hypothetical protein